MWDIRYSIIDSNYYIYSISMCSILIDFCPNLWYTCDYPILVIVYINLISIKCSNINAIQVRPLHLLSL